MKTYFDAVCELVGAKNVGLGPSNGPLEKITFVEGFTNFPTEKEIQAKLAELKTVEPMRVLREERNRKLAQTDWRASSDLTLSNKWKTYRQALRDLPSTATPTLDNDGNLQNVTWPNEPN